jgi:hypothetical protein
MSTLLLPELAREMAAFNRRVADSVEAEARRVERLQEELAQADTLRKTTTRSAREALRHTLSQFPDAQAVWRTALEVVRDGVEGGDLKQMLQDVQSVVDTWLTLAEKTRVLCRFAAPAVAPDKLDELTQAEAAIREVKTAAEKMSAFVTRPKPAVDPARLQQGRNDIEQGRIRTAEQMLARLDQAET